MLFIGVAPKKYIQININNLSYFDSTKVGIKGSGKQLSQVDRQCDIISCNDYAFY